MKNSIFSPKIIALLFLTNFNNIMALSLDCCCECCKDCIISKNNKNIKEEDNKNEKNEKNNLNNNPAFKKFVEYGDAVSDSFTYDTIKEMDIYKNTGYVFILVFPDVDFKYYYYKNEEDKVIYWEGDKKLDRKIYLLSQAGIPFEITLETTVGEVLKFFSGVEDLYQKYFIAKGACITFLYFTIIDEKCNFAKAEVKSGEETVEGNSGEEIKGGILLKRIYFD